MSRFIKSSIAIPTDVKVHIDGGTVNMSGPVGEVSRVLSDKRLEIKQGDDHLTVEIAGADGNEGRALAGTYWRLLDGMVSGVKEGCVKTLELVGVGYRAQLEGTTMLVLQLGFSHPIRYALPEQKKVKVELPSQTEIIIKGADKQLVGQVAAEIRSYRPPEPYKGKGVRYRGERVIMKETKKK